MRQKADNEARDRYARRYTAVLAVQWLLNQVHKRQVNNDESGYPLTSDLALSVAQIAVQFTHRTQSFGGEGHIRSPICARKSG